MLFVLTIFLLPRDWRGAEQQPRRATCISISRLPHQLLPPLCGTLVPPREPTTPVMAEVSFSDGFSHLRNPSTPMEALIIHCLGRSALDQFKLQLAKNDVGWSICRRRNACRRQASADGPTSLTCYSTSLFSTVQYIHQGIVFATHESGHSARDPSKQPSSWQS
jgi:hypothetical protein